MSRRQLPYCTVKLSITTIWNAVTLHLVAHHVK